MKDYTYNYKNKVIFLLTFKFNFNKIKYLK